ncbi:MAG: NADH-quinone oxidoreductase subunit NuoN, partial [Pseudomonadota bacterium]
MTPELAADFMLVMPELVMATGAMTLLMLGAWGGGEEQRGTITLGAALLMLLVAAGVATSGGGEATAFEGAFIDDAFARFAKVLILVASAMLLLIGQGYLEDRGIMRFEYPVLIVLATLGMMMMVSSGGLISLYVGLELQSLALYVVAAFNRDSVRSTEAGLKYFVLGALSSGMLLYGASLIYGFTGSVNFQVIANAAKGPEAASNLWLIFGLVFLLVGLAFKISAVPFHMWTPDVYEGSATSVTAFFSAAPKVAAMALLVRVMLDAFPGIGLQWQQIIAFLAVASMLLGAFAAIGQTDIKRMLAYSSIANIGFALIGLAANSEQGTQGVLIYMAIYLVMTLGAFACVLAMRRDDSAVTEISELAGLAQTNLP